ncbi:MAG: ATP-dependent Clp protease proteolytic subunit [Saprospiraceae bacterium]|nr:ATP-dependent Clp protease proteolytic subunit [Candidatus Vicinibacter affinis]
MPARNDIATEILNAKNAAQDNVRRKYISDLATYTNRDTIIYITAYTTSKMSIIPPALVSIVNDDIHGFMSALHGLNNDKLDLIIHSPGGSAEAAEQIINYLRAKYSHIRVIVPQSAMSAATMIACASDEIILGKHSAIGPIDPQITFPTPTGLFTAPAHSLLAEFEQAKSEVASNPNLAPIWVNKLKNLPHGILDICKNTTELSKIVVEKWLKSYMFKLDVDKDRKSNQIAEWLGTASNHKTHGRPIPISEARSQGLNVIELESDPNLQEKVLSVFHSTIISIEVTNCIKIIENQNGKGTFSQFNRT